MIGNYISVFCIGLLVGVVLAALVGSSLNHAMMIDIDELGRSGLNEYRSSELIAELRRRNKEE